MHQSLFDLGRNDIYLHQWYLIFEHQKINFYLFRLDLVPTYIFAKKVRQNISSARKVFKFLRFIDEYRALVDLLKKGKKAKKGESGEEKGKKIGAIEIEDKDPFLEI